MTKIKTVVVDASVLLKTIFNEEDSIKAEKLINQKDNCKLSILVPDIFRYEFFQQVTRKANEKIAQEGYSALFERQISTIPLEVDIIKSAQKIMARHPKISFYDAAYHVLAIREDGEYLTADREYARKARSRGSVTLLSEWTP